jgi:hypothetical protein
VAKLAASTFFRPREIVFLKESFRDSVKSCIFAPAFGQFCGFFDECRAKQDARPMSGNATSYACRSNSFLVINHLIEFSHYGRFDEDC